MEMLTSRDEDEKDREVSNIFDVDPDFSREVPTDFYSKPRPPLEESAPWIAKDYLEEDQPFENSSHVPTVKHAEAEDYKHSVFENWSDDERMKYKIGLTKFKTSFKSKAR